MPRPSAAREARPLRLPAVDAALVRETRRALGMTRSAFAASLGMHPRTLERWEQGRSSPGREAAALILLVRHFPDTVDRLASLDVSRRAKPSHKTRRRSSA